jgi:hypothetical protein
LPYNLQSTFLKYHVSHVRFAYRVTQAHNRDLFNDGVTSLSYTASNNKTIKELRIEKDVEENCRGLIEALYRHLPVCTEENHKNPLLG